MIGAACSRCLATMPMRVMRRRVMAGWKWIRNSTLPFWPVIGDGVDATRRQSYLSARGRDLVDHARVHGRRRG